MSLKMFVFLVRLLWLVWWTIPMTRMKKMTTKKSSLRGSGLAWVLKADCSDFLVRVNRFGPVLPPLVGSLGHVPFFSLSEETVKAEGSCITAPPPPNLCFSFSVEGVERLFWKPPAIPCRFYTDPWPRSQSTLSSLPFHPLHKCILLSRFWFSLKLFCHHHHLLCADQLEFLLKTTALWWFPALLCCYSNRSEEAVWRRPCRNHRVFTCPLPLHAFGTWTNELQRRRKTTNQPVYQLLRRPVRLAGLAVSYSELDWLK